MEFVLSYKMGNQNIVKLNLKAEFLKARKQKIPLKG